ncbi:MAG: N-6 DNA methylase [Xanthomonadales bacterium]|nr:N-6 DNA methylase [Xanthomonadales bacterium]
MNEHVRSEFGRYYTKPAIGQALVDLMHLRRPDRLIDLGVGGGSLTLAAARRWSNLDLLTIDVDATSDRRLTKLLATEEIRSHRHLRTDALEPGLAVLVRDEFGRFGAAVCNPPFTTPVWRKGFDEILEESGFSGCMPVLADSDSALLFLSQALRLLGQESTLGIILPDSLVSGAKYRKFRQELLRRYRVDAVVGLPNSSFMHTEAVAHIVIVRKGYGGSTFVPLRKLANGKLSAEITLVNVEQATARMDFDYHATSAFEPTIAKGSTVHRLGELVLGIHRGSVQATASRQAGMHVFHTTEMPESSLGKWIALGVQRSALNDRRAWAEPGDILVARVGRNLERKVLGIISGCALLTDCVYRVRMPTGLATTTLKQLSSDYGRAWLASRSSGVGARHLSLADLLNFPVHLEG